MSLMKFIASVLSITCIDVSNPCIVMDLILSWQRYESISLSKHFYYMTLYQSSAPPADAYTLC